MNVLCWICVKVGVRGLRFWCQCRVQLRGDLVLSGFKEITRNMRSWDGADALCDQRPSVPLALHASSLTQTTATASSHQQYQIKRLQTGQSSRFDGARQRLHALVSDLVATLRKTQHSQASAQATCCSSALSAVAARGVRKAAGVEVQNLGSRLCCRAVNREVRFEDLSLSSRVCGLPSVSFVVQASGCTPQGPAS